LTDFSDKIMRKHKLMLERDRFNLKRSRSSRLSS
jgi:hypothetical protein